MSRDNPLPSSAVATLARSAPDLGLDALLRSAQAHAHDTEPARDALRVLAARALQIAQEHELMSAVTTVIEARRHARQNEWAAAYAGEIYDWMRSGAMEDGHGQDE